MKIAIVGTGGIAQYHARAIPKVGARLQAICDVSPEALQRLGEQFNVEGRYRSLEEMLEREELDIAIICTWGVDHAEISNRLARSGRVRAILCEKPICANAQECAGMIEVARENEVLLAEAFKFRHHPQHLKARELVDAGRIGPLHFIRSTFAVYSDPRFHTPAHNWRFDPARGGGAFFDLGCYNIHHARFMAGMEPVRVWAAGQRGALSGVEESAAVHLEFPGGLQAQCSLSFCCASSEWAEIHGEEGIIRLERRPNPNVLLTPNPFSFEAREVERRVLPMQGFDAVYTRTGGGGAGLQDRAEDTVGVILLQLADWKTRPRASALMQEMRRRTADLAGVLIEVRQEEAGPPVGKPVQLQLSAVDPALLPAAVAAVRRKFEQMPGLVDIEDSRPLPGIEWQVAVDRGQAAKFGADVTLVGTAVRLITNGMKFAEYRPDDSDKEIDIAVRYPAEYRALEQIGRLKVQTRMGLVPIDNFVTRAPKPKVGTLNRSDGRRVLLVKANVRPGVQPDAMVREIRAWLPEAGLDPLVRVVFKGQDKEQAAAQAFLSKAFGLALFLIAIILVAEFNSFFSTLLVLTAVLLSTVGVLIGMLATGQAFGIVMTGIAVISLAGVVVKNNIVLIDTYDDLRQRIADPREAILRTGAQRLRPVFLTAATVVIGLTPLSFGTNIELLTREIVVGAPASQWWVQLATAMVYGMCFATPLTLVVTPSALMLKARLAARLRRDDRARL